jgi:hypothetical protein
MRSIILIPLKLRVSLSSQLVLFSVLCFPFVAQNVVSQALRPVDSFRRPLPAEEATFSIPGPAHLLPFAPPNSAPPPKPSNCLPSLALSTRRSKHSSVIYSITCLHGPDAALDYITLSLPNLDWNIFLFLRSWINRRCGCAARSLSKSFLRSRGL